MPNGFMTAARLYELNEERSRAYGRATAEADARALTRQRVATLEGAIRNGIAAAPDVFAGLDAHGAALLVVQAWEG